jgi:hypothetical protein
MTTEDLRRRLQHALETREDPLRVAALAGRLARVSPYASELSAAPMLGGARLGDAIARAADLVVDVDPDGDPAESLARLRELDGLCAAAAREQLSEQLESRVALALDCIRAFPEAWRVHASTATAELASMGDPTGDLGGDLWAAVEGAAVAWAEPEPASAPWEVLWAAGVVPELRLAMAAHGGGIRVPQWQVMAEGNSWEVVLTEDVEGPMLLVLSDEPPAAHRDEISVVPARSPEGYFLRPSPGRWSVSIGGRRLVFTVPEP